MTLSAEDCVEYYAMYDSPVGALALGGDGETVFLIGFPEGGRAVKPRRTWRRDDGLFSAARAQLTAWFAGERTDFDFPIRLIGTDFRRKVWCALQKIGYGETCSYADIAQAIDRPPSTYGRAIGGANGANPLPIVVPCHRVIGADGSLTGYGGGLEIKQWLLDHEMAVRERIARTDRRDACNDTDPTSDYDFRARRQTMPIYNRIAGYHEDLTATRRDIHAHPELGFEEHRTSDIVAKQLESWGIEVHRGIAGTGVVGVLRGNGNGAGTLGIRADMDALPMQEVGAPAHKSTVDGKMHACGHDGHTTMLLGAARYLAETRNFDGTVNFIFQPAEEGGGGGRIMVEEGLFEQFPCDTVWGMHNAPHLPAGTLAMRPGPMLAAVDRVEITIDAKGCHAAQPHTGIDPIAVGVQLHTAMQTIVSRNVDPIKSAVVSITRFHAGTAINVIAQTATMSISVRTFDPDVRALVERRIRDICAGAESMYGVSIAVDYGVGYPATVNHETETAFAADVARDVVGADLVNDDIAPVMGSEDFSYMLEARPGTFLWIGAGKTDSDPGLHHPEYDFNDDVLPLGASYWAKLVETRLPRAG